MSVPTSILERYAKTRAQTEALCARLTVEDHGVQSMPDASPPKWHLAHTSWFFETFLLSDQPGYVPAPAEYAYLFNSYYEGVGPQFPRARRGTLSRPTVEEVMAYRQRVDAGMHELLTADPSPRALELTELGMQHEAQHQELLVVDIKHGLLQNPLDTPITALPSAPEQAPSRGMSSFPGGLVELGHRGDGFSFDNEHPRHRHFLEPFLLCESLVTNEEFLAFIDDDGYRRPELWLSDGWHIVQSEGWRAPLYWEHRDGGWTERTLGGRRPLALHAPACHLSFFEAEAFARWRGMRLPTEAEWEHAAEILDARPSGPCAEGTFLEDGALHPEGRGASDFQNLLGEVWEHTSSAYRPYPGFVAPPGAVGEYNGKFMNGQYVLRGGSAATARDTARTTYRNFFAPDKRWVFTGLRLAADGA